MCEIKKIILILFLIFFATTSFAKDYKESVKNFIEVIKTDDPKKISKIIAYPLERHLPPLPSIKNEQEFIEKYDMLFDDYLKEIIINSDVNKNWSSMSYDRLMLDRGIIWLADDKLIAINYHNEKELEYKDKLRNENDKQLHSSLNKYKNAILVMKTKNFLIRIDELDNGYRYASWKNNKTMADEPDLIIYNGIEDIQGTGPLATEVYFFANGKYIYEISNSPTGYLMVYKINEKIKDLSKYPLEKLYNITYFDDNSLILSEKIETVIY